jgi:hypothetical protein
MCITEEMYTSKNGNDLANMNLITELTIQYQSNVKHMGILHYYAKSKSLHV